MCLPYLTADNSGNLAVRSLAEVVTQDDFIPESEYMETLMVAVPK